MSRKKPISVKLLKDFPGGKAGDEFKFAGCGVVHGGTGTEVEAVMIGGHSLFSTYLEKYKDFFELIYP